MAAQTASCYEGTAATEAMVTQTGSATTQVGHYVFEGGDSEAVVLSNLEKCRIAVLGYFAR